MMSVTDITPARFPAVPRWEPDASERLEAAAVALFRERGYQATTAAQIAQRAGLTERTFFRRFGDKREVLFFRERALERRLVGAVDATPADAPPLDAVAAGFRAMGDELQARRDELAWRARLIAGEPELAERELAKLASLSAVLADALARRGADAATARLAAETAIAVFRIAFERWIDGPARARFADVAAATLADAASFFGPRTAPRGRRVHP
jgi:AcrR family transcriptional regulator